MKSENDNKISLGLKIAMFGVVVFIALAVLIITFLPMLQTVGTSFGFGLPSGSGGRAVRDVEIDVEPQVVYRIDEHRFFTFEKYLDCNSGGFVYYNDINKNIKKFAGIEGVDKKPQNELTVMQVNSVLSYHGRFIYSASDNVIAYPEKDVNYKYGGSNYFITYQDINEGDKKTLIDASPSSSISSYILDGAIFIQRSRHDQRYEKYSIPKKTDDYEWIEASSLKINNTSEDDRFHCDNSIKPKRIKYIKN